MSFDTYVRPHIKGASIDDGVLRVDHGALVGDADAARPLRGVLSAMRRAMTRRCARASGVASTPRIALQNPLK